LFAHAAAALNKTGIVVFQNINPGFFGYPIMHNIWDSGGCKVWPCNRPVGALLDMLPGYKNPKSRERLLWECPDQKCAKMSPENLEKVFLEVVEEKVPRPVGDAGHNTLQEAMASKPLSQKSDEPTGRVTVAAVDLTDSPVDLQKVKLENAANRTQPQKPKRPTGRIIKESDLKKGRALIESEEEV
jgi:hypothetical protein